MARYRNRYPHTGHGLGAALKWMREFRKQKWDPVDFPLAQNDPAWLKANRSQDCLTWVGHSTFLLQLGGLNLLTDPHFSGRASPFSFVGPVRTSPPGLGFDDLPAIDLVLVSHNHYDHLDEQSVRRIARDHTRAQFVVPLGLANWFRAHGIERVTELDWWRSVELGAARVSAVPVQHFSGRGVHDRDATLWCGFVVELAGRRIFFAGDTGYSRDFADIAERFPPMDLSLLPIGAYDPRWFMSPVHVDPAEAVRIHQDLRSRLSVAMHWGTFRLTAEPLDEPPQLLAQALSAAGIAAEKFTVFRHGETRLLDLDAGATLPPI
ncbi:MBL fold metallo-hydrolase [Nevskia soli]|uniref:MBL fold metallo-hydrolase n=1 Tax=Nevskia soli TaxID=418856 RepID=UPI00068F8BBE|nr:MBL fold metallo-hydrolase [Nevskia soli]